MASLLLIIRGFGGKSARFQSGRVAPVEGTNWLSPVSARARRLASGLCVRTEKATTVGIKRTV